MTDTSWIKPGAAAVWVNRQYPRHKMFMRVLKVGSSRLIMATRGYGVEHFHKTTTTANMLDRPTPAEEAEINRLIPCADSGSMNKPRDVEASGDRTEP